jgi:hypothetical protein
LAQAGEQPKGVVEIAIAAAVASPIPPRSKADAVRRLACTHYEERGCGDGHDLDDWLRSSWPPA